MPIEITFGNSAMSENQKIKEEDLDEKDDTTKQETNLLDWSETNLTRVH